MMYIKRYWDLLYWIGLASILCIGCSNSEPEKGETVIQVTPESLIMKGGGDEAELVVKCALSWQMQVKEGSEWCQCSMNPTDASKVVVTVYNNESTEERVARISFSVGGKEKIVEVVQEPGQTVTPSIVYPQVESDIPLSALADARGNIIPDFSHIGYMGSEMEIPDVATVMTLEAPADGSDMTEELQSAIDEVSGRALSNGFRGAILLKKGTYNIEGTVTVKVSGIVLRGEGEETKLVATGATKRTLIQFVGGGH